MEQTAPQGQEAASTSCGEQFHRPTPCWARKPQQEGREAPQCSLRLFPQHCWLSPPGGAPQRLALSLELPPPSTRGVGVAEGSVTVNGCLSPYPLPRAAPILCASLAPLRELNPPLPPSRALVA